LRQLKGKERKIQNKTALTMRFKSSHGLFHRTFVHFSNVSSAWERTSQRAKLVVRVTTLFTELFLLHLRDLSQNVTKTVTMTPRYWTLTSRARQNQCTAQRISVILDNTPFVKHPYERINVQALIQEKQCPPTCPDL
jgi:hypothetical protein